MNNNNNNNIQELISSCKTKLDKLTLEQVKTVLFFIINIKIFHEINEDLLKYTLLKIYEEKRELLASMINNK